MKTTQRGVAIVEFALVLPLLLILTFITTEFGRALYQYNTITKSVRDAARYLSTQTPGSATAISNARKLVVYGNPAGTGSPLAVELDKYSTPVVWQTTGSAPLINTVTIKVTGYTFVPLITSAFGLTFGNITYADISATMRAPL